MWRPKLCVNLLGIRMPLSSLDPAVPGGSQMCGKQQDDSSKVSHAFKHCICGVGVLIKQQADMAGSQPGALTEIAQNGNVWSFKGFRFNSIILCHPVCGIIATKLTWWLCLNTSIWTFLDKKTPKKPKNLTKAYLQMKEMSFNMT